MKMPSSSLKVTGAAAFALLSLFAKAEMMDRPVGIKIGEHLTLKPYVSLSVAYDSNVDSRKDGREDVIWTANPALNLVYRTEQGELVANVFYQYNAYSKNKSSGYSSSAYSYHGYGENVTYRWTNSNPGERGWGLMFSEKYQKITQLDDAGDNGYSYGRDRDEVKVAGALQRRFGGGWHADLNANYYWLSYDNKGSGGRNPYGLYGWQRWGVGGEIGYAVSKWTDILVAGSYQDYRQDNTSDKYYTLRYPGVRGFSDGSQGWTAQIGFGSFATDHITYRVLAGWSCFKYTGESGAQSDGFTYTASGNWRISETWNTMLLATSYYQPSEREYAASLRVDSLSWGLAHIMVQGKLAATFDIAFRREGHEYSYFQDSDYDLNLLIARLGLNYTLNRYLQLFCSAEYRNSDASGNSARSDYYDYDRFRGTLGLRFTY